MRLTVLFLLTLAVIGLATAGDTILGARALIGGRFKPEHCCAWIVTVRGRRMKHLVHGAAIYSNGIDATIGAPLWVGKPPGC